MNNNFIFDLLNANLFNIYDGEITFFNKDIFSSTQGKITFLPSPYPQIIMTSHKPMILNEGMSSSQFLYYPFKTKKDYTMDVVGSEVQYQANEIVQSFSIRLDNLKSKETEVDEIFIFIMNCDHIGLSYLEEKEYHFEHQDWIVNFKFRPDRNISTHYEYLRKNRGYDITHVGIISKKDKQCFKTGEIEELISKIEWYLTFGSANKVFIPIQIGFKNRTKVWEKYVSRYRNVAHFQDNYSWVPMGAVEDFNNFFPSIAYKLGEELWSDVLEIVLNWYLEIKDNGMIENQIISIQVALELLSWTYLVIQEQMIDKEAYKKLRATDIIRLLCYQLNISREIVDDELGEFVEKYKNDGVFMFVEFRNNLIHPEKKANTYQSNEDLKSAVYLQGLYFLERAITKICGYEGAYDDTLE
jgi:hypothetical protein